MSIRLYKHSSSNNPLSEPALSSSNVGVHNSKYNGPSVLNKNHTVHSYGSYGESSDYVTMKNIDRPDNESFHTIKPSVSQSQHYPPHASQVFPLKISSNVLTQQVQHAPVTHFPLSSSINQSKSQYHHSNGVIEEQSQQQANFYKAQYFQLMNGHQLLKERYQQLVNDYDSLRLRLKAIQNNEQVFAINNEQLMRKNSVLSSQVYDLGQELQAARMHNDSLVTKLNNTNRGVGVGNIKVSSPIVGLSDGRANQSNINNQFSSFYQPSLRQLQHQNRQLLFRIQQYQSSILYKNTQLQKYKIETQAKQIQINSMRRQIQTYIKRQKLHKQEEKLTQKYILEAGMIPHMKQEIVNLKSKILNLTQTLSNRQAQLQSSVEKWKSLQQTIQGFKKTLQNNQQKIKELQDKNSYLQRLQYVQHNIPHNFSKVLTTYIGDQSTDQQYNQPSYQHQDRSLGGYQNRSLNYQDRNQSFSNINQGVYKNIGNIPKYQIASQPTRNQSQMLTFKLADGIYNRQDQSIRNYQNQSGKNQYQQNKEQNQKPNTNNLATKLANQVYQNKPSNTSYQNPGLNTNNLASQLAKNLYDQPKLNQQQYQNQPLNLYPSNLAQKLATNMYSNQPTQGYQNREDISTYQYQKPSIQSKISNGTNKSSNLRIQDQAFYDFAKQFTPERITAPINQQKIESILNVNEMQSYLKKSLIQQQQQNSQQRNPQVEFKNPQIESQIIKNFSNISKNNISKSNILDSRYQNNHRQSDFILEYPQLPFRPRQNSLIQHSKYLNQQQNRSRQKSPVEITGHHSHHRHKIFRNDDSLSYPDLNQSKLFENLQKKILQLSTENKDLRRYLIKKSEN